MHQSYPADLYKSVCNLQLEASRQKTNLILEMKGTCHPITKYYNASLGGRVFCYMFGVFSTLGLGLVKDVY